MGLLNKISGFLLGEPGGLSGRQINGMWDTLGLWDNAYNDAFSPEAYNQQLAQASENYQRNAATQRAAAGGSFGAAGFRDHPNMVNTNAWNLAHIAQQIRAQQRARQLQAIQARFGMLQGFPQNPGHPGLLQGIAPAIGQYLGNKAAGAGQTTQQMAQEAAGGYGTPGSVDPTNIYGGDYQSATAPMAQMNGMVNGGPTQADMWRQRHRYQFAPKPDLLYR